MNPYVRELLDVFDTFNRNRKRAALLLKTRPMDKDISQDDYQSTLYDIVRQSIVFTHAILEDNLREIMRIRFKYLQDVGLPNQLPVIGAEGDSKVTLNWLSKHHRLDKTISELVQESLQAYLERRTFNSFEQVCSNLQTVNLTLPKEIREKYQKGIDALCDRRRQIVHQADQVVIDDRKQLAPISPEFAMHSAGIASSFTIKVIELALTKEYSPEIKQTLSRMADSMWEDFGLFEEGW